MTVNLTKYELKPKQLRWKCPIELIKKNAHVKELDVPVIGQDQAMKSLRLGIDMKQPGYHVFVSGFPGTGRHTAVKYLLEFKANTGATPFDWCYVYNFQDPNKPTAISLPAGQAGQFKKDIEELIRYSGQKIPGILKGDFYRKKQLELIDKSENSIKRHLQKFEKLVVNSDLSLDSILTGAYSKYILKDKNAGIPLDRDEIHASKIAKKSQTALVPEIQPELSTRLSEMLQHIRLNEEGLNDQLRKLEQELVRPLLIAPFQRLREKYSSQACQNYFNQMQTYILENLTPFREKQPQAKKDQFQTNGTTGHNFREYQVNIVLDNSQLSGVPVICEETPTLINLFGIIERPHNLNGQPQPDFLNIRPGSLLNANGGYLVINLSNLSSHSSFWIRLKQILKTNSFHIETNYPRAESPLITLRPEPIPIDLKVILIGEDHHYYELLHHDTEFLNIFKIRADFDTQATRTNHLITQYIAFLQRLAEEEKLLPFHSTGLAMLVEEGVRVAGWCTKMTTEMSRIADFAREASYWAETEHSDVITETHVATAIREMASRLNLLEGRVREQIITGYTLINLTGTAIGQINSLVIREDGEYQFGKPNRLTARSSIGRSGIINIERESDFSGRSHSKGISILKGYFRGTYAQDKELNFSASLCFEQSYSKIDGDSASAAEVFVLLSSLAEIPIRQDIAVTGSINQFGEIQPVGGVNEKIEGFFFLCEEEGLTRNQGVIIPARNLIDLQLRQEVVEAVKTGKFTIYAIDSIDEGLVILTGMPAGVRNKKGKFRTRTIHYLVDEKLRELNRKDKDSED